MVTYGVFLLCGYGMGIANSSVGSATGRKRGQKGTRGARSTKYAKRNHAKVTYPASKTVWRKANERKRKETETRVRKRSNRAIESLASDPASKRRTR